MLRNLSKKSSFTSIKHLKIKFINKMTKSNYIFSNNHFTSAELLSILQFIKKGK